MPFRTALPERGSKLLTTLLHLSRPTHPYIVVMTLAVIMRPGRHHAAGPSSCGRAVIMRPGRHHAHHLALPAKILRPPERSVSNRLFVATNGLDMLAQ